jgi:hypothetical protein
MSEPSMTRRGFLGGLFSTIALPVVSNAAQQTQKAADFFTAAQSLPKESKLSKQQKLDAQRRASLIKFLSGDADYAVIGVDHGTTEADLMKQLAHPEVREVLKKNNYGLIGLEVANALSPVYSLVEDVDKGIFKMAYHDAYVRPVLEGISDPKKKEATAAAYNGMIDAEYDLIKAYPSEGGIAVYPYDKRFDNDIQKRMDYVAEQRNATAAFYNSTVKGIDPDVMKEAQMLAAAEGPAVARQFLEPYRRGVEFKMIENNAPEHQKLRKIEEGALLQDDVNRQEILAQTTTGKKSLIVVGEGHIETKGALASLLKENGKVSTMSYLVSDSQETLALKKNIAVQLGRNPPDLYLNYTDGNLTKASELAMPAAMSPSGKPGVPQSSPAP